MAENAAAQEPTMEEILASIRRIISEDGATVEEAPPPDDTVLDLTEAMEAQNAPPPEPPPEPEPPAPEVVMEDNTPEPAAPPPPPEPEPAPPPPPPEPEPPPVEAEAPPPPEPEPEPMAPSPSPDLDRLVSDATAQATATVFSSLASPHPNGASLPLGNGGRTLESMVLELVKPVLKDWLDKNLPGLVERVVQKEIRKITRDLI